MFYFSFKKRTPKQTPAAPGKQKTRFEQVITFARSAWPLPSDYADWFSHNHFDVLIMRGMDEQRESQSPLHRVSDAWHADVPEAMRDELLASEEYRQAVMHVFSKQTEESLVKLLSKMGDHGYWSPMAACVRGVLARKWYGTLRTVRLDENGQVRYSYTVQD